MPGSLPPDVRGWFTSSIAVPEERCDTYLLVGRGDVGVKRRFRETLELKVRQSLDGRVELGEGLGGSLEEWRRWSPAEGLVDEGTDGRWVDVDKSIVKRRFCLDGTEIAFSPDPHPAGAGCDVEVAGVTVGTVQAWTFAFAAVGHPRPGRTLCSRVAGVGGWHPAPRITWPRCRSGNGLPAMAQPRRRAPAGSTPIGTTVIKRGARTRGSPRRDAEGT